jgi:hypothetical protein
LQSDLISEELGGNRVCAKSSISTNFMKPLKKYIFASLEQDVTFNPVSRKL